MRIKRLWGWALTLGFSAAGPAVAADYTVGITDFVNYGQYGLGTALNAYEITGKGVELLPGSPYVLHEKDAGGNSYLPSIVAMNAAHDFLFVEYVAISNPLIVGFKITAHGLEKRWQQTFEPGNNFVNSMIAGRDYVIIGFYPNGTSLWASILNESGQILGGGSGDDSDSMSSVQVSAGEQFFYQCRDASSVSTVVLYTFNVSIPDKSNQYLLTSTDPAFYQGICEQGVT